jgi:hypothetical protein
MTQWRPAGLPYRSRSHAAVCWDAVLQRLHVVGGWHGTSSAATGGTLLDDSWRSANGIVAERSTASGLPAISYLSAVANDGTVLASPGYDGPLPPDSSDNVNDLVYASLDGGLNFAALPQSIEPHEHGWMGLLSPGSSDFAGICGGLRYVPGGYVMNTKSYVVRDDLTIQLRNANFPYVRRGFGCAMWHGRPVAYGGRNDELAAVNYSDAWAFTNDMTGAAQVAAGCDPGSLFGHAVAVFNGRYVVACGAWSGGYTADVWSSDHPNLAPGSWVRHATFPGGALNGLSLVSVIKDGVPKLLALGGRDLSGHSVPGIRETTDLENWTDLTGSDLWGA